MKNESDIDPNFKTVNEIINSRIIVDLVEGQNILNDLSSLTNQLNILEKLNEIKLLVTTTISNLCNILEFDKIRPYKQQMFEKWLAVLISMYESVEYHLYISDKICSLSDIQLTTIKKIVSEIIPTFICQCGATKITVDFFTSNKTNCLLIYQNGYINSDRLFRINEQIEVKNIKGEIQIDKFPENDNSLFITFPHKI